MAYNSPNSGGQKFGICFPGLNENQGVGRAVLSMEALGRICLLDFSNV